MAGKIKHLELHDKTWLLLQYEEKNLSTTEISKIIGCTPGAVLNALKRNNIKTKPRLRYAELNDKKWLILHYEDRRFSTPEIATILGCSANAVNAALTKNNIQIRSSGHSLRCRLERNGGELYKYPILNDKNWLQARYIDEGLSLKKIATIIDASSGVVRSALFRAGIEIRNISDANTYNREEDGFILNLPVITGALLGDGYMRKFNKCNDESYPYFAKKNIHYDHIEFVVNSLFTKDGHQRITRSGNYIDGKWYPIYVFRSLSHKELLPIYQDWYPESNNYIKVVPKNIEIDETVLLHWFLDDGTTSYRHRGVSQRKKQASFNMCSESFTKEDQQFLCEKVYQKFNLPFKLRRYNHGGTGWRISLSQNYITDFYDIIGKCPVPSFEYKWKTFGAYEGR